MAGRAAICDPAAFDPFRRLVEGPLAGPRDLEDAERFIRTAVLHDDLIAGIEPLTYRAEDYEDQNRAIREKIAALTAAGVPLVPKRPVGLTIMATAKGFEADKYGYGLFRGSLLGKSAPTGVKLSLGQLEIVSKHSNAAEGNPFYTCHLNYLQQLFGVVKEGGSVLCEHPFPHAAIEQATQFPAKLFESLDNDWKEYAQKIQTGRLGLVIPPVLSIVLDRCARRDAIPAVVADLRRDWERPRRKVWQLVEDQKRARTLKEVNEIEREFAEASKMFSPTYDAGGPSPRRMLWDIFAGAGAMALTATLAGGDAKIGALTGGVTGGLTRAIPQIIGSDSDARNLFRRGAFDLAGRVRKAAATVGSMSDVLVRFLSDSEKRALGYTT